MSTIKQRSLAKYILLAIVTFGIYPVIEFCQMGDDINKICAGDGQEQMSYIFVWLLAPFTLGILPLYWTYKAMERMRDNAYRYNVTVQYGGSDYLLWVLLGMLIFVGPFIGIYHFMQDINQFSVAYDMVNPAPYTVDINQRATLRPIPKNSYAQNGNNYYNRGYGSAQNGPVQNGSVQNAAGQNQQFVDQRNRTPDRVKVDAVGETDAYNNNVGRGKITCTAGMYQGISFPIQNKEIIRIGKDPTKSNVIIDDPRVSSLHCSIQYDAVNNTYIVTDSSTNGTYTTNGQRLNRNVATRMPAGSVISILGNENSFKLS